MSPGRPAPDAVEERGPLDLIDHGAGRRPGERGHPEGDVLEDLGEDAAQAEQDGRSEGHLLAEADDDLRHRPGDHGLDHHPSQQGPGALRDAAEATRRANVRSTPSSESTPTSTRPRSDLWAMSADSTFMTTGSPMLGGGRHGLECGGRHRLGHRGDAEGGQELLRLDLVEGARRQELLRLAGRVGPLGRDLEKRVGQRGHEGGEVDQGLDPPHGGAERVEKGHAGIAEGPVGRLVAQRRAPDGDDRLAPPAVQVDQILGQGVAHAGEDPGDGGQQDVGVGVLEHQLEDGPAGGQGGDGAAGVDRVVLAQEPRDVSPRASIVRSSRRGTERPAAAQRSTMCDAVPPDKA